MGRWGKGNAVGLTLWVLMGSSVLVWSLRCRMTTWREGYWPTKLLLDPTT